MLGAAFDARSGLVQSVVPSSPASRAGLRAGDSIDFARAGWPMHVWLNRGELLDGQTVTLPVLRSGRSFELKVTGTLRASSKAQRVIAWVGASVTMFYLLLGLVIYTMRRNAATFAFFVFCVGSGFGVNTAVMWIAPPNWEPLATALAAFQPATSLFGFLYFGLLFGITQHIRGYQLLKRVWVPYFAFAVVAYWAHFYSAAFSGDKMLYTLYSVLYIVAIYASVIIITVRLQVERGAQAVRLRWVAVALWCQAIIYSLFYIEQNLIPLASYNVTSWYDTFFFTFKIGPLAIAYALVQTRLIDVRIVGGRAFVYGVLTAIPIGILSLVDWVFARQLADARLATVLEIIVAVLFGVWLNVLHKRIDRFVERVLFASRHRSFQRLRHVIHALPAARQRSSVENILTEEAASALHLASAALFLVAGDSFERVASFGWDQCVYHLSPDDPLVLFARSSHASVHLPDVSPTAAAPLPGGDAKPGLAVPILVGHLPAAIALYGSHTNGEPVDADEEQLLIELCHAASGALERLEASEHRRALETQLAMLRGQINSAGGPLLST